MLNTHSKHATDMHRFPYIQKYYYAHEMQKHRGKKLRFHKYHICVGEAFGRSFTAPYHFEVLGVRTMRTVLNSISIFSWNVQKLFRKHEVRKWSWITASLIFGFKWSECELDIYTLLRKSSTFHSVIAQLACEWCGDFAWSLNATGVCSLITESPSAERGHF